MALCADNQNALRWAELARSNSPVACRIRRALNLFFLQIKVDVLPVYVRSGQNLFADGLTRCAKDEIDDWALQEGTTQIDAATQLWAGMSRSYNPNLDVGSPRNIFAFLGNILHFYRHYNYRICEWRPSHYDVTSVLGNWGGACLRSSTWSWKWAFMIC